MEDFQMYSRIQQHKKQGFTRDAAARRLGISWSTVNRYWDMTIEDYEAMASRQYSSNLDQYRDTILGWLQMYRDVSSAQIQDWILEHYEERFKKVKPYVLKHIEELQDEIQFLDIYFSNNDRLPALF